MGSIVRCLRRNCFETGPTVDDDDDDNNTNNNNDILAPRILSLNRGGISSYRPPTDSRSLSPAAVATTASDTVIRIREGDDATEGNSTADEHEQRQPLNPLTDGSAPAAATGNDAASNTTRNTTNNLTSDDNNSNTNEDNTTNGVSDLFRRIRHNILNLDTITHRFTPLPTTTNPPSSHPTKFLTPPPQRPHLTTAHNFSQRPSSNNIPSLPTHSTVVLPGSDLQRLMSESLTSLGIHAESSEAECVVCMEGFDPSNPRMPTRCGCGVNKTMFHLPCLYQWVELRREGGGRGGGCPSCREMLVWDEF